MDNSAQNSNQPNSQNLNQSLGPDPISQPTDLSQSSVPPMPPLPQTPPVENMQPASDQPVFMGPAAGPTEEITSSASPMPNDTIPSLTNTLPTSYPTSSGGGARRIATALFGILMLAVLGVGGYFAQQQLLKPREVTTPSAAIPPCSNYESQGYVYIQYYNYACPGVDSGEAGCQQNSNGGTDTLQDFIPNYCGTQQRDALMGKTGTSCQGGVSGDCVSCFIDNKVDLSSAVCGGPTASPTAIPGCVENWCAPGGPWYDTCCLSLSEGAHCQHTWDDGFYAACFPATPTPTETALTLQCTSIKIYNSDWEELSGAQLASIKAGDLVRFAVMGTSTGGTIDRARFRVNGGSFAETATLKPGTTNEFYLEWPIPAGVTTFTVEGEVHHTTLGWK